MEGAPLYRVLRPLAGPLVRIFHRRISVEHRDRVPLGGPVVLAANHPNMMLDVLLVASSQPRVLHFLAKATLFENPLLSWFLSLAGVLAVYRKRDSPEDMASNLRTFAACHDLLAAGGAIAIFPEGLSHAREAVLPLKTGCARIVLEAEAAHGFGLGTRIVPVGIAFSHRELFRSDALVVFGEPIDPSPRFVSYREGGAAEAVCELTSELESALRNLTLHVPHEEDEKLISTLRQFFTEISEPTSDRIEVDRVLVEAIHDFRERRPLAYSRLRRQILAYGRVLTVLGASHHQLDRSYRAASVIRYAAPRLLLALIGLGPFLAGASIHYFPYKIPAWVAGSVVREPVERATVKLVTGVMTFSIFYALLAALMTAVIGGRAALLLLALAVVLGIFSLLYLEVATDFFQEARIFFLRLRPDERIARLRAWRRELASELEAYRRDYEASQAVENPLAE